jgi:D-glycero-D-manno-heptose 1,7-bisphosphate phosphatase
MSFIILDRDGVINHESSQYIKSPAEWEPIPGSLEAMARLNRAGFRILLATNQSGIGRGYFDIVTLDLIHEKLQQSLAAVGGYIEAIFFCPHHPEDNCDCRKPKAGLINQMRSQYRELNVNQTFFIGDSWSDIEAAKLGGCLPLLVLTGKGQQSINTHPYLATAIPNFINLTAAVDYVLSYSKK